MTVRENSAVGSLQCKVNRDILFKLLWQKPTIKSRREIVHSAGCSFPSQISRKLMFEEHKLELQLEQIEKERKQFLSKNSNEKHMLELSVRTAKATERRRNSGQYLVMNDNTRCYSSDQKYLIEGNDVHRKSWHSTTNGVFYPCGAKSVRQLQVKKVYLTKKIAERNHVKGALPWRKNFVTPQVPPPSRSPSRTNIIWVSVHNKSGAMDSFVRTDENSHEMTTENKKDKDMTKMEDRELQAKSRASVEENILRTDKNTTLKNTYEEDNRLVQRLDCSFRQSDKQSTNEQKIGWIYEEAPDTISIQHQVLKEQLAPTVKGLTVIPNEIRRRNLLKQRSDEKSKNEKQHYDDNEYESKAQRSDSRARYDTRQRPSDDRMNHVLQDRVKTATPCLDSKTSPKKGRQDFGYERQSIVSDRQSILSDRQNIVRNRLNIMSERSNIRENDQQNIGSDRETIKNGRKNIGTNRKIPTEVKCTKESKNKRNRRKSRESGKNSSTKISKRKSVQKFVHIKPNIQGLGVFAKTFTITSGSKCKDRTEKKTSKQENKKTLSKPQSATRINGKKSPWIKLPRKSCSACTVKLSSNDDNLRVNTKDFRSKSDTTAGIKVREAGVLYKANGDGSSQGRKSQSPQPIMLPSQSQLQNFDKVAKNKLRKTLAVKMRRHCYTGTWAFPCAKLRKNEME